MEVTIYALCEPDTGVIRYVGKAIDFKDRLRCHIKDLHCPKSTTRKDNWLRSLNGVDPISRVLEVVPHDRWQDAEKAWIARLRADGCDLTNITDGGQTSWAEGRPLPEATKQKMREAALRSGCRPPSRKGTKSSDATRAKQREANLRLGIRPPSAKGRKYSDEVRARRTGRKHSEESLAKMRAAGLVRSARAREARALRIANLPPVEKRPTGWPKGKPWTDVRRRASFFSRLKRMAREAVTGGCL